MNNISTNNNRLVLLLIAGIPMTMILAASWLWFFVMRGDLDLVGMVGTANRGELLQPPRQFADLQLLDDAGHPVTYDDLEPRWSLVVVNSGEACDQDCEHNLYMTRQIHVAMGKEFSRIRRLYVGELPPAQTGLSVPSLSDGAPLPASFAGYLEAGHRGIVPLHVSSTEFTRFFAEQESDARLWYLADPAGWVMMTYNADVSYKDVISDLKFLLKNSSD
jgi:hypothetical protein